MLITFVFISRLNRFLELKIIFAIVCFFYCCCCCCCQVLAFLNGHYHLLIFLLKNLLFLNECVTNAVRSAQKEFTRSLIEKQSTPFCLGWCLLWFRVTWQFVLFESIIEQVPRSTWLDFCYGNFNSFKLILNKSIQICL